MRGWRIAAVCLAGFAIANPYNAARGQSFPALWPQISSYMRGAATNLESGGVVTNMPAGGYIQNLGSNRWIFYFPVAGVMTQVVTYVPPAQYLNVAGGLLTMSGDPTSGVNIVELVPASLTGAGFVKSAGTPATSWEIAQGNTPYRISRVATGFAVRDYGDTEYRDLTVRNLYVGGTSTIVNTETLDVNTNRITLNANITSGTPTMDAYIYVSRGALATAAVEWVEAAGKWKFGTIGALYTIEELATNGVAGAWPGVTNVAKTATDATSNLWPWVVNITPTEIWNWNHGLTLNPADSNRWSQAAIDATSFTNWWGTNNLQAQVTELNGRTGTWNQAAVNGTSWTNWWGTNNLQAQIAATMTNVTGGGTGTNLVKSVAGRIASLKGLKPGSNVTITDDGTDVTIASASVPAGSGSVSNLFWANRSDVNGGYQADTTWTKLVCTNIVYNIDGNYATNNSRYTVAAPGKYLFMASLGAIGKLGPAQGTCRLYKNAAYSQSGGGVACTAYHNLLVCFAPVDLSAGDYVEIYDIIADGYNEGYVLGTTNLTWIAGWRVL